MINTEFFLPFGGPKFIWWQNPLLFRSKNDSGINSYVSPNQRASWNFFLSEKRKISSKNLNVFKHHVESFQQVHIWFPKQPNFFMLVTRGNWKRTYRISVKCLFYCFFPTSLNCLPLRASLRPSESYNSAVFSSTVVRRSLFSFVTLAKYITWC